VRTLKKIRRANGLSQHALARKSGVPRWRIAFIFAALGKAIFKNVRAINRSLESSAS
jgi:predicted transcriptional regulator